MKGWQTSYMQMVAAELGEIISTIKLAFLDVGQADTIVISCSDTKEAIVVDCVNAKAVRNYLTREQITQLRGIIVTHLHLDHYSEVPALLKNYRLIPGMEECKVVAFNEIFNQKNLQKLIQDDYKHSDEIFSLRISTALQDLISWRDQNDSKYALLQVQLGSSIPYQCEGSLINSLHLLHPHAAQYRRLETKGLNNTSVILQVIGPGSKALLTGDLEPYGWKQLCANHQELQSDVLKFPHHGGAWKFDEVNDLLDKVNPSIVVISVGSIGAKYMHPHPDVFRALAKRPHIRVLCTQATNQCHHQQAVQNEKSLITHHFKAEAESTEDKIFLTNSRGGCPCAGTVIIELGEKAQVVQPELAFHRNTIITPHLKSHQCSISSNESVEHRLQIKAQTT